MTQETIKSWNSSHDPRACALLADEYERAGGHQEEADCIRLGMPVDHASHVALLAIATALASDPPPFRGEALTEQAARIIDPTSFRAWEGTFNYGVTSGETPDDARATADHFHKKAKDEARAKAREILALSPALVTPQRVRWSRPIGDVVQGDVMAIDGLLAWVSLDDGTHETVLLSELELL